jgi:hypothetical protein
MVLGLLRAAAKTQTGPEQAANLERANNLAATMR